MILYKHRLYPSSETRGLYGQIVSSHRLPRAFGFNDPYLAAFITEDGYIYVNINQLPYMLGLTMAQTFAPILQ